MDIKSYLINNIKCDNCALLGYYTKNSGNSLPRVRDNLPVPLGPVGCLETSMRNYHYSL